MIKLFFKLIKWPVIIAVMLGVIAWFYPEKFLTVDSGPVPADVIIVMGGGHDRALRAAQLFNQNAAPRVIITGAGDDEINRRLLIANGVPARAIDVENKSTTTRENAEFTGSNFWWPEKSRTAILVTSWYHARRATKKRLSTLCRPSHFFFAPILLRFCQCGLEERQY